MRWTQVFILIRHNDSKLDIPVGKLRDIIRNSEIGIVSLSFPSGEAFTR